MTIPAKGYQLWIADALRRTGYPVIETPGWQTRGNQNFQPRGLVVHHDGYRATVKTRDALHLLTNGRKDLPGPLCQIWLDDDDETTAEYGDPVFHLIAAGRANHAGTGAWNGLSGNSSVLGIEARHTGGPNEPWSTAALDAYHKGAAALAVHGGFGSEMVCGHKEWTTRKVDPTFDMHEFRRNVKKFAAYYTSPAVTEIVTPAAVADEQAVALTRMFVMNYDVSGSPRNMRTVRYGDHGDWVRLVQGITRWLTKEPLPIDGVYGPVTLDVVRRLQTLGKLSADGIVGPRTWEVLRFFVFLKDREQ